MKRFFAILLIAVMLLSMLPSVSVAAQYGTVVGGWLRLRSAPNFNAETITSYYTGTVVEITGNYGSWYRVFAPDGRSGYMYGQYLKVGSSSSGSSSSSSDAYITSHNGYGVRLRVGPGTGYRVVATYEVGTPVKILERGSYWSKVKVAGVTGYMMTQFLSGSSSSGTSDEDVECYATIWSRNGYGVRLRTGKGKDYDIIGTYSVGTQVAVLDKNSTWDKVRVGSRVGYMMNEFLDYHDTHEVTSVTINNYSPAVGSVLCVQAISPSKATVSYEWRVNGVTKGTASTYTVTADDVGYQIQLKVKGTGSYTGSAKSAKTDKVLSNTQLSSVTLNTTAPVVGNKLTASIQPASATVLYAWIIDGTQVSNASSYEVKTADIGKTIKLIVTGTGNYSGSKTVVTSAVAASGTLVSLDVANTEPAVGDTLTAVVKPDQATVKYSWFRNGVKINSASGNTYKVTQADLGTRISVTAEGTGNYTGSALTFNITNAVSEKRTAPVIETNALVSGKVGENYGAVLSAQGTDVTWTVISGTLPAGLTLASNGAISGKPTVAGTYEVTFQAANSAGKATVKLAIVIEEAVVTYTLTVGNGSGSGTYDAGAAVAIKANDRTSENKVFTGWVLVSGKGSFVDSSAAETVFQMADANAEIKAEYADKAESNTEYTITINVNGSITTLKKKAGDTIDLLAPDMSGKIFTGWQVSGAGSFTNSTANATTFHVGEGDASVTAVYVDEAAPKYTLTVKDHSGTTTHSDKAEGQSVDISATIPEGYEFINWTLESGEGSFYNSNASSTTFVMGDGNATVKANYAEKAVQQPELLTVIGGTADSTQLYPGESTNIYASGESGAEFTGWTLESGSGNFHNSGSANTTFYMGEGGATIKANYSKLGYSLTVNGGSGSATGIAPGEGVEISAPAPASDQVFTGWVIVSGSGNFHSSKKLSTTFYIGSENTVIEPTYAQKKTVSLTVNNGDGSVSGVDAYSVIEIEADEISGKEFVEWILVSGDGNFYNRTLPETTFHMKETDAVIEATYMDVVMAVDSIDVFEGEMIEVISEPEYFDDGNHG